MVPRSQNPIFLQGKYSINIILAMGTDGGTPGALTGAGAVLNLENHKFRALPSIWLDFGRSGRILKDFGRISSILEGF